MKVTSETITDEQIRELQVGQGANFNLWSRTRDALNYHPSVEPYASIRREAREYCAAVWNARHGGES